MEVIPCDASLASRMTGPQELILRIAPMIKIDTSTKRM
ncbi:hypothetical protein RISK_004115 [Rhodopirellula islandica]|uniref:Uncharacterized protein n=1 Tax=Rhodopirellula islandica TaxID=595434 RepID=A0A0J1BAZ8_RHOIS|nr:hypothetical protein RISK_004115 [Rhodopirellula islandica]